MNDVYVLKPPVPKLMMSLNYVHFYVLKSINHYSAVNILVTLWNDDITYIWQIFMPKMRIQSNFNVIW